MKGSRGDYSVARRSGSHRESQVGRLHPRVERQRQYERLEPFSQADVLSVRRVAALELYRTMESCCYQKCAQIG